MVYKEMQTTFKYPSDMSVKIHDKARYDRFEQFVSGRMTRSAFEQVTKHSEMSERFVLIFSKRSHATDKRILLSNGSENRKTNRWVRGGFNTYS